MLARVLPRVRDIRRAGAAALDLCMVAAGRWTATTSAACKHWDWAAGSLIVKEAGGTLIELERRTGRSRGGLTEDRRELAALAA